MRHGAILKASALVALALLAATPPASGQTERPCKLGQEGQGEAVIGATLSECIGRLITLPAEGDALGRVYGRFGTISLAADRDRVFRYYEDTDDWVPFWRIRGNPYITLPSRSSVAPGAPAPRPTESVEVVPVPPESGAVPTAEGTSPHTNNAVRESDDADKN